MKHENLVAFIMACIVAITVFIFALSINNCHAEIELVNPPNKEFVEITKKYSPYFKDNIKISFVDDFGIKEKLGSTRYWTNGYRDVVMKKTGYDKNCGGYCFEFVLIHEIGHWYWIDKTEEECNKFADEMMNYVNKFN